MITVSVDLYVEAAGRAKSGAVDGRIRHPCGGADVELIAACRP